MANSEFLGSCLSSLSHSETLLQHRAAPDEELIQEKTQPDGQEGVQ